MRCWPLFYIIGYSFHLVLESFQPTVLIIHRMYRIECMRLGKITIIQNIRGTFFLSFVTLKLVCKSSDLALLFIGLPGFFVLFIFTIRITRRISFFMLSVWSVSFRVSKCAFSVALLCCSVHAVNFEISVFWIKLGTEYVLYMHVFAEREAKRRNRTLMQFI